MIATSVFQLMHDSGAMATVQVEFDGKEVKVNTVVLPKFVPPPPPKIFEFKQLCPFCNHLLEEELYNGIYGCDTGCEYVSIEIECPNCHKVAWSSGTFGNFENKDEKAEYRAEFMEEFAEELQRIAPDRLNQNQVEPLESAPKKPNNNVDM